METNESKNLSDKEFLKNHSVIKELARPSRTKLVYPDDFPNGITDLNSLKIPFGANVEIVFKQDKMNETEKMAMMVFLLNQKC